MFFRGCLQFAYALIWAIVFALIGAYLGAFGGGAWLFAVLGAAAGVMFANRTRDMRWLHRICGGVGGALAGLFFALGWRFYLLSQARRGDGPMAGFGEAMLSILCLILGTMALLFTAAGVLGILLRWRNRRATNQ